MSSSSDATFDNELSNIVPNDDNIHKVQNHIHKKTESIIKSFNNNNILRMRTSSSSSSSSTIKNSIIKADNASKIFNRILMCLMSPKIRNQLLHKCDWKSVINFAKTSKVIYQFVKKYIQEYNISHKYESIEQFLQGCKIWSYLVAIDNTSVIYHAISKLAIKSFAVFYTHDFVVLPLKYAEDAIGVCWLYANALSRYDRGEKFKNSRIYDAFKMIEISKERDIQWNKIMLDDTKWVDYIDNKERGQKWIESKSPRIWINAMKQTDSIKRADLAYKSKILGIFDEDKLSKHNPITKYITQREQIIDQLLEYKLLLPLIYPKQEKQNEVGSGVNCVIS